MGLAAIRRVAMLEVYLQRHGIAQELGPGGRDADRALTAEGKRKLQSVLGAARKASVRPGLILTSPYKRAVQTAELAAQVLACPGGVLQTDALKPGASPQEAWAEIRRHRQAGRILLAGHEPLFSQLAAYLMDSPGLRVDFKKGAILRIDFETAGAAPRGVLKWMITPSTAG